MTETLAYIGAQVKKPLQQSRATACEPLWTHSVTSSSFIPALRGYFVSPLSLSYGVPDIDLYILFTLAFPIHLTKATIQLEN